MPTVTDLKAAVCTEIDRHADEIVSISDHVMRHPETGFRETATARLVAERFADMGLGFRDRIAVTGVKARMRGRSPGPTVGVLGELDALVVPDHPLADPDTGAAHACGHNAQIASMLGTGMGLQAVMDHLYGDVVLFAVPAEECVEVHWRLGLREEGAIEFIVGKAELIRLGEFDDIDMVTITHTPPHDDGSLGRVGDSHNGSLVKHVRFLGRAAHAGAAPWRGVNALKTANLALAAVDAQRDLFRDDDTVRVHAILTAGGAAVSSVPAEARLEMMIRAKTLDALRDAAVKVDRSLRAGAMATGARVEIETVSGYLPHHQDANLVALSKANCVAVVGGDRVAPPQHSTGSTDMGDLSFVMPVVHPRSGGVCGSAHSVDYWVVNHHAAAVNPAKSMAMTVIDLLGDHAGEATRVLDEAGTKLSRAEYVKLRSTFDAVETYPE